MLEIIARTGIPVLHTCMHDGMLTHAEMIVPEGNGDHFPMLCPVLRDVLALCLADNAEERPSLEVLLPIVERQAKRNAATYAPYEARETDEAIEGLVRLLLYNAALEPNVQLDKRQDANKGGTNGRDEFWSYMGHFAK